MRKQFMVFTSVFMILSAISLGSCTFPDCTNAFPGQYVPDLDNCHNYYICPDGVGNVQLCPDGGCFNPVGYCDDANSDYCFTICQGTDETTASTKASTPTITSSTTISTTAFTSPTTDTNTPTTASAPVTTPITIPKGTTTQSTVTTIPGCNGEHIGAFVPDPEDCHNYYICGVEGHPPLSLETCPNDSCFNPNVRFCEMSYCSDCLGTSDMTESTTPTTGTTPTISTTPTTSNTPTTATITTPATSITTTAPITSTLPTAVTTPTTTPVKISSTTTKKPVMCGNYVQGTMKPDPTDCRKYFLCTSAGQWILLPCPSDSCFFEDLLTCYQNADFCTAYCGDVSVTSTTASTTKSTKTSTKEPTSTYKTTITPTTITTTPTGQPSDCYDVNSFICPRKGYFAKCNYCTPEYFYCNGYGHQAQEMECNLPFMFSPNPAYPFCVRPENCPYPPIKPTTTPDPVSGCTSISDFYCPRNGYFAKCDYCVSEYFYCDHQADQPTQGQCTWPLLFNPNPNYPYCVQPYNCPFNH